MPWRARPAALTPIAGLLAAMASIQVGAALAQTLFPFVGAEGTTALRVSLAALMLLVLRRPSIRGLSPGQWRTILAYGASLGAMNLLFYMSLRTIPLGVAVAVEFTGPLALALASHRRRLDLAWTALAAVGLLALTPLAGARLDPAGLLLALGAGACWSLYIVFGQKTAGTAPGAATALGMVAAALLVLPFGLARAGTHLFQGNILPAALAVAVLSSALPYSLEMFALVRLPRATFGTLMSVEPAIGAIAGWLLLGQRLSLVQDLAIGCIVLASAGAALSWVAATPDP